MILNKKKSMVEEKILDVDASMHGALTFRDSVNLKINGKFEGTLELKGSLTIAETALVEAEIRGDEIIIEGKFKGKIFATAKVTIKSQATMLGDIYTKKLVIEEGAVFEGVSKMLQDVFNVDELAKYLEIERSSILEWINQGKLPGYQEDGQWRFERKRVDEWISSEKV